MTKGSNFVKNKKFVDSKPHAHLQIMMIYSGKFQVNSIKAVAGVVGTRYESARAITSSKMAKQKSETTCTFSYDKKVIYKISNQSDERRKRSCGDKIGRTEGRTDRRTDRRTDGHTHGRMRVIAIVPSAYVGGQLL